jgi:DNA-binding transcriptional regulator YiaG
MKKSQPALYTALGFPIMIENPSYIEFEGEQILDVNPGEIQEQMFRALVKKPARLTGAEVRFLRSYMELTQGAFGESLLVDASTVSKWEKTAQKFTGMPSQTEMLLRMRCNLHMNGRAHIASSFIDNLAPVLRSEDIGELYHLAV